MKIEAFFIMICVKSFITDRTMATLRSWLYIDKTGFILNVGDKTITEKTNEDLHD